MHDLTDNQLTALQFRVSGNFTGHLPVLVGNDVVRAFFRDGLFTHTDRLTGQNATRYRAYYGSRFVTCDVQGPVLLAS